MRQKLKPIKVKCYSGYKAYEKPVSFIFRKKVYQIEDIVSQSIIRSPGEKALSMIEFRVRLKGGELQTLIFDQATEEWYIKI